MKKTDFISIIEGQFNVPRKVAKRFADSTLCTIMKGVETKGVVKLSGFWTFKKARINDREYRNPQNPKQTIFREACNIVRFRAWNNFKKEIK